MWETPVVARGLFIGLLVAGAACGPSARLNGDGGGDANPCLDGSQHCNGNTLQVCTGGTFTDSQACANACDELLGCVVCHPNTGVCNGNLSTACKPDGSGTFDETCDAIQGVSCNPASGLCEGACSSTSLGSSYIGCDYYPTVTGNMVSSDYDFAVVVSNTTMVLASVTVEGGALTAAMTFTVAPRSVVVQRLPWQTALKLCSGNTYSIDCLGAETNGALVAKGAYHLRSTVPVTVYQFNPLDYTKPTAAENSYTVDASLLLPTNAWRTDYYVASWQQTGGVNPGEMAVTAAKDGTMVTITTRADTPAAGGAPAFTTGVPGTQALDSGGVLELATLTGDLTGTHVTSDKPIQVIGGHYCANVPDGFGYCDHLEESMFSVDALGSRYLVNAPAVTTIPAGKEETVRIVATAANTTLTYEPMQMGAPTTIANPGDFVEIPRQAASYLITANHKVMVFQLMEGSSVAGGTGDPAMALTVPVDQFRSEYLFHAPTNYETNYVDVTAPMGAMVTLDGTVLANPITIGASGYVLYRVTPLGSGPANDGNHQITGSMPFGISVYGYGQDTSYWYPGGLNLKSLTTG
jgi:hypothetical protein